MSTRCILRVQTCTSTNLSTMLFRVSTDIKFLQYIIYTPFPKLPQVPDMSSLIQEDKVRVQTNYKYKNNVINKYLIYIKKYKILKNNYKY